MLLAVVLGIMDQKIGFMAGGSFGFNDKSRLRPTDFYRSLPADMWGIGDAGYQGAHPKIRCEYKEVPWISVEQLAWNLALHRVRQSVERVIHRLTLFANLKLVPWRLDINSTEQEEFFLHHCAIKIMAHTTNVLLDEMPLSANSHPLLWTDGKISDYIQNQYFVQ